MQQLPSKDEIVSFFLKVPSQDRRSFSIVRRVMRKDGKPAHSTVKNAQTKSINALLSSGSITPEYAKTEFKTLIKHLYENENKRRGILLTCPENQAILASYLDTKYPPKRRKNIDFQSAYNETARTLQKLGNKSILSMTAEELQDCVDTIEESQQRRYASRLHSLLRFLGRHDFTLYYVKPHRRRVKHLNQEDLSVLVKAIKKEITDIAGVTPDQFAQFVVAMFGSGLRIGEALALDEADLVKQRYYLKVTKQLKQNGTIRATKNKKERKALVLPFTIEAMVSWANQDKSNFCRFAAAKYLSSKTRQLFKDSNKHVSLHGLRHSYAIYLLRVVETSISNVATFLGDSIKVTEDYYIDYVASDETIESVIRKIVT